MKLSFIVIGRNEGWRLSLCLESIQKTVLKNGLTEYEVIYVDSESSDDSIERAKKIKDIKIFRITGIFNAAIARNIGASESIGDVLFFIDGDMEIDSDFLTLVYSEVNGLISNFVSGNWINYNYDTKGDFEKSIQFERREFDKFENVTGGLFLIKKNIWSISTGMDPIFKIGEDIDFGLRLAKEGVFLLRKKEIAATHHTVAYLNNNRMWRDLLLKNHLFGRSLLYRKNWTNKYMIERLLRNDYSMVFLFLIPILFLTPVSFTFGLIVYALLLLIRAKLNIGRLFYFALRDLSSLIGVFIFFPDNNRIIRYKQVLVNESTYSEQL